MVKRNGIKSTGLYSIGEVADILDSATTYVRRLVDGGDLTAHRIGLTGRLRITGRSLAAFLDRMEGAGHD